MILALSLNRRKTDFCVL